MDGESLISLGYNKVMEPANMSARRAGPDGQKPLPSDLRRLLGRLARDFRGCYGDRYRGLILYGSYARGEADEGSDVDLLLLLEGEVDPARELRRTQAIKWPLALEADYAVFLLPVSVDYYESSDEPFMWNARRDGMLTA